MYKKTIKLFLSNLETFHPTEYSVDKEETLKNSDTYLAFRRLKRNQTCKEGPRISRGLFLCDIPNVPLNKMDISWRSANVKTNANSFLFHYIPRPKTMRSIAKKQLVRGTEHAKLAESYKQDCKTYARAGFKALKSKKYAAAINHFKKAEKEILTAIQKMREAKKRFRRVYIKCYGKLSRLGRKGKELATSSLLEYDKLKKALSKTLVSTKKKYDKLQPPSTERCFPVLLSIQTQLVKSLKVSKAAKELKDKAVKKIENSSKQNFDCKTVVKLLTQSRVKYIEATEALKEMRITLKKNKHKCDAKTVSSLQNAIKNSLEEMFEAIKTIKSTLKDLRKSRNKNND